LVGFQRLELPPGDERQLSLLIPARQRACFDADRDGFVLEAGRHRLVLARHADDPGQAWELELKEAFIGH
ncbi:MAG: fibronectin type III-like domain-contianing protein, partial [Cyanobium sp.]